MRFFELPFEKLLRVSLIGAGLVIAVIMTFIWKQATFGTTPVMSSAWLASEEATVTAGFRAYHALRMWRTRDALIAEASTTSRPATAVPVLIYHRLALTDDGANVSVASFADQMQTLYERGWRTITLKQYEAFKRGEISVPERSFLITFDDGAQQSVYPSDPVLATLGFTAVQYVIVVPSESEGSTYYLSSSQIKALLASGRWEIGSHSYDAHHPYPVDAQGDTGVFYSDKLWLADQGRLETDDEFAQRVDNDLALSRSTLEGEYGTTVDTIAFPFGLEAGIKGANTYPGGEDVTVRRAAQHYAIGWEQSHRKDFTFEYQAFPQFMQYRIHVDHDWDGTELADFLEGGIPKSLPYDDSMAIDRGWRNAWGDVAAGGILQLKAVPTQTSASSILDGSRLWKDYETDVTASWQNGAFFVIGDALSSDTYRSCVFTDGQVAIQDTISGEDNRVAKAAAPIVTYGSGLVLGMRITPTAITCTYGGVDVLTAPIASRRGGIGVQTWNATPGTALATITHVSVHAL